MSRRFELQRRDAGARVAFEISRDPAERGMRERLEYLRGLVDALNEGGA